MYELKQDAIAKHDEYVNARCLVAYEKYQGGSGRIEASYTCQKMLLLDSFIYDVIYSPAVEMTTQEFETLLNSFS